MVTLPTAIEAPRDPRAASSMTLALGDGLLSATRWTDGTVSVVAEGEHREVPADTAADALELLARFARGAVRVP